MQRADFWRECSSAVARLTGRRSVGPHPLSSTAFKCRLNPSKWPALARRKRALVVAATSSRTLSLPSGWNVCLSLAWASQRAYGAMDRKAPRALKGRREQFLPARLQTGPAHTRAPPPNLNQLMAAMRQANLHRQTLQVRRIASGFVHPSRHLRHVTVASACPARNKAGEALGERNLLTARSLVARWLARHSAHTTDLGSLVSAQSRGGTQNNKGERVARLQKARLKARGGASWTWTWTGQQAVSFICR